MSDAHPHFKFEGESPFTFDIEAFRHEDTHDATAPAAPTGGPEGNAATRHGPRMTEDPEASFHSPGSDYWGRAPNRPSISPQHSAATAPSARGSSPGGSFVVSSAGTASGKTGSGHASDDDAGHPKRAESVHAPRTPSGERRGSSDDREERRGSASETDRPKRSSAGNGGGGKTAMNPAEPRPDEVQVYAPGFRYVLNVPASRISHLPPASLNVTRLVLCANYDPKAPETSCPMGARCKFVHADTTAAKEHAIHVNYAWRSLDDVTYERYPTGQSLHVAPPNSKVASDTMDSSMTLRTKALSSNRRPLSHCAHYYFNRTCNLGAECRFVHAVFIDPNAKDHQRAPIPSMRASGTGTARRGCRPPHRAPRSRRPRRQRSSRGRVSAGCAKTPAPFVWG
jgi:hypothetical protein